MAARKSSKKSAGDTKPAKEPAPPKVKTFKATFREPTAWHGTDYEYYTNAVTAEDAFPKMLARFRELYPKTQFNRLIIEVADDITFVP